jgi:hypothetical protein
MFQHACDMLDKVLDEQNEQQFEIGLEFEMQFSEN